VLGEDSGQGAETTGGLKVSHKTNDDHGGGLNDSDGLDDLLLVNLGSRLVGLTEDVRHTGLVSHEGSQVAILGSIVPGEGANATAVV